MGQRLLINLPVYMKSAVFPTTRFLEILQVQVQALQDIISLKVIQR